MEQRFWRGREVFTPSHPFLTQTNEAFTNPKLAQSYKLTGLPVTKIACLKVVAKYLQSTLHPAAEIFSAAKVIRNTSKL